MDSSSFVSSLCKVDSFIQKPKSVLPLESLQNDGFHLLALFWFILAIVHTFSVHRITHFAQKLERKLQREKSQSSWSLFFVEALYFLGEVEVVFGLWVIPLFFTIAWFFSWTTSLDYLSSRDYTEAIFVVVIMSLTSTKPIVKIAEKMLSSFAKLLGGKLQGWWLSLLTIGPLLGSFITEAGAMTLCALLLSKKFYAYKPSKSLCYATVALLFVNISVGGSLTNFAAPPLLVVSRCWGWTTLKVFYMFGIKALVGTFLSTLFYFFFFRKDLRDLERKSRVSWQEQLKQDQEEKPIPLWITLVHIGFIVWVVTHAHYPVIFVASYLLLLGFIQATKIHQYANSLKRPLLVGFFLAGLVIHAGVQGWWIVPSMQNLSSSLVMVLGTVLTAFNDNAAVAYLTSLIPNWPESIKYAMMSGVLAGGGLTVIANAPNPAGYVLLQDHFKRGISPLYLFLGALFPTLLFFSIFYWFPV